ncbi:MAG: SpaA isopeptide-forming pilin-related protein, partial [Atopobiaceae bacterium]|nr:SpaA isopeptide-forming pilin-related protein [Atopobiaceae bacterium]
MKSHHSSQDLSDSFSPSVPRHGSHSLAVALALLLAVLVVTSLSFGGLTPIAEALAATTGQEVATTQVSTTVAATTDENDAATSDADTSQSSAGTDVQGLAVTTQSQEQVFLPQGGSPTSVTVRSLDQYGNGVYDAAEGATQAKIQLQVRGGEAGSYSWTDVTGDNATWTVASADDASAGHTFTGLTQGTTYRVVEATVATGYRTANHTDTQSIEFAIGMDGMPTSVSLNNGDAANGSSGNDYLNVGEDGGTTFILRSELEVGQAQFTKYDSTTIFDEQGSPTDQKKTLSGASFDLYREDSAGQIDLSNDKLVSSAPIVSDSNGLVSTLAAKTITNRLTGKPLSEGLGAGTYYFKEVGTRSDFCSSTSTTNAFTVTAGATTNYTWSDFSVNTLNTASGYLMRNTPLNAAVTLTKVDAGDAATKVNGATYELRKYTSETDYTVIGTQKTSAAGTRFTGTDSNGNTHSRTNTSDGQLWFVDVPAGTYEVVETAAAPGYMLDATAYEVTVAQSGVSSGEDYTIESAAGKGTVADEPISFTVTKGGIEGASAEDLAGTGFSLVPEGEAKFADGTTDAIDWTTTTTDASKVVAGKLVADGTSVYKLSETAAPAGYQTSADVYLRLTIAGTLQRSVDGQTGWADVTNNALTVSDTQNSLTVTVAGVEGATTTQLTGAGFSLVPEGTATFAGGTTAPITWATDSTSTSHDITGEFVAGSVYKLSETAAPAGYRTSGDVYLMMDAAGNLSQSDAADGAFTSVTNNVLTVTDTPTTLKLSKVNDDPDPATISGSTFTLTGVFVDGSTSKTLEPTDGGAAGATVLTGQLVASTSDADETHTYTLTETMAPAGFAISMSPKTLRVSTAGRLQEKADGTWTDVEDDYILVPDARTSFSVAVAGVSGATSAQLAGTKFELTPVGAAKFADGTTDFFSWSTLGGGTTNNPYTMVGRLVADGTSVYKLSETVAPAGYQTPADVYLRMTTAGTLQRSADGQTGWADVTNNALTMVDVQNGVSIAKVDTVDAGGKYLAGAEFSLYGTFADGSGAVSWTSTDSAPADGSGLITGKLVASTSDTDTSHVYVLSETKAPDGYVITVPNTWLRITEAGQLQVRGGEEGSYTWTDVTDNTFKAVDAQNSLTLKNLGHKTEGEGTVSLAGCDFTITGTFVGGAGSETRTLLDGATEATMTGQLVAGNTYTISETAMAKGYSKVADFRVRLEQDGTLALLDGASSMVTSEGSTVTVTEMPTFLVLFKTNAFGDDEDDLILLGGSTFVLTGEFVDGTTSKTLNPTDKVGAFLSGQLFTSSDDADESHTYTLTETVSPEGYELSATSATLRITAMGQLQEKVDGTWNDVARDVFYAQDEQNSLGLVTTDTAGTTRLSGATCTVGGTFAGDTEASTKTLTSAADSVAQLTGALAAGRDYTIKETTPAAGYLPTSMTSSYPDASLTADGAMTIRMSDAGELSYKTTAGTDTWASVGQDNVLEFEDVAMSFTFSSVDRLGNPDTGSTFTLTGTYAGDATASTLTLLSGDASQTVAGRLVAGSTYTLEQTAAPAGYACMTTKVQVTCNANGTLPLADGTPSSVTLDAAKTTLAVVDSPIRATILTTDENGTTLAGATFTLAGTFA